MNQRSIPVLALASLFLIPACTDDGENTDALGLGETESQTGDGDGDGDGTGDGDGDGTGDGDGDGTGDGDGDGDGDGGMGEPDPDAVELPDPADYDYSAEHVFTIDDVVGDFSGRTLVEDPTIICLDCETRADDSTDMYPIDSAFGFTAIDFVGAAPRDRDGMYQEGWIGGVSDPVDGHHQGVSVATQSTLAFRTGALAGAWCAGAGSDLVKCSTEKFSVMEHVLTCAETLPYHFFDPVTNEPTLPEFAACEPLDLNFDVDPKTLDPYEFDLEQIAYTTDFAVTQKDDGKVLYRWGTWDKRPTDLHMNVRIPLPAEWTEGGQVYTITRAELAVVHTIANSPNDQIRPEDWENEAATGRLPAYEVLDDGRWVSTIDCYEGDGDFIPAGTTLRNPLYAIPDGLSSDLVGGYTNAWFTSTDREPFDMDPATGSGPRWRLRSSKMGQNLPGGEIPLVNCTPPPLKKGENKYNVGEATATIVNLLDWKDGEPSPFATSTGWIEPAGQVMSEEYPGVTSTGLALTEDFDLSIYIKGEYKPARVYKAVLYLDYELQ